MKDTIQAAMIICYLTQLLYTNLEIVWSCCCRAALAQPYIIAVTSDLVQVCTQYHESLNPALEI